MIFVAALVSLLGFMVGTGEFLRNWNIVFGGFVGGGTGWLAWQVYVFSLVIDNGLANFNQVFGLHVSDIQPVTTVTKSLVWGYNILLGFWLIATAIHIFRRSRALDRRWVADHPKRSD